MALQVEVITGAAVTVNGTAVFGGPVEITFAPIKTKTGEYMSLGMLGTVEYFLGFEKMECTLKTQYFNADIAAKFGDVTQAIPMQIRTNKDKLAASGRVAQVPLVYKLTATPKSVPGFASKAQEAAEFEMEFSVSAVTIEENGVELWHFDANTNTYRVAGIDKTATFRANLGI